MWQLTTMSDSGLNLGVGEICHDLYWENGEV
jgi:hypothetical protein